MPSVYRNMNTLTLSTEKKLGQKNFMQYTPERTTYAFQNDAKRKQINPVFLLGDSRKINWIPWAGILLSL